MLLYLIYGGFMKNDELFIEKSKHRVLKLIITILVIAAISGGGYYYYVNYYDNPNKNIVTTLEKASENIEGKLNKISKKDKYKVNGLIKLNFDLGEQYKEITDLVNNLSLQINGQTDPQNKIVNLDLNSKFKDDKLINIKTIYQDNNAYLYLDELYDKYLKLPMEEETKEIENIKANEQDIEVVITKLLNASKNELEKLEVHQKNEEIIIDNQKYSVTNNYIELKNKEVNNIYNHIIETLSNDSKFTKALSNITGQEITKEDILKELNNEEFDGTLRLNFYFEKSGMKKTLKSVKLEVTEKSEVEDNKYEKMTMTVNILKDDEYNILIDANETNINMKITFNEQVINIDTTMNAMDIKANIIVNLNYEKIDTVEKVDVSNYKDMDKLTEDEMQEIYNKMENNEALIDFFNQITGLIESHTEV